MLLKPGDVFEVRENSRTTEFFKELPPIAEPRNYPAWLERDIKTMSGKVLRLPDRSEIDGNLTEQLIVEFYSR
jgi:small subunit ribosomal protein S4